MIHLLEKAAAVIFVNDYSFAKIYGVILGKLGTFAHWSILQQTLGRTTIAAARYEICVVSEGDGIITATMTA